MKVLDGSKGEGGGQILRTALFLSTLTQEAIRVEKIRQGRPKPGLKPQHVGILRLLARVSDARIGDPHVGDLEVEFHPGRVRAGSYPFDLGTAGSVPLVLQTLLPCALLADGPITLDLVGGTDVRGGPTIDWVRHVFVPRVEPLADRIDVTVARRGFEPAGGGHVRVHVRPRSGLRSLADVRRVVAAGLGSAPMTFGRPRAFEGTSVAEARLLPQDVPRRQIAGAAQAFSARGLPAPTTTADVATAASVGTSVTLWVEDEVGLRLGADAVGARGLPAEEVGRRAAQRLFEDLDRGPTADRHLSDHLVPWVALGAAPVRAPEVTGHLSTNVWVCQELLGRDSVRLSGRDILPANATTPGVRSS